VQKYISSDYPNSI